MVSEEVKFIKENLQAELLKHSMARYGVIFGYQNMLQYDACFARLGKKIKEQGNGGEKMSSMQYLLRYENSDPVFDYRALMLGLNDLFGKYFKITIYLSGKKDVRIVNIKDIKELPSRNVKYAAYYVMLVLLRAIDAEYLINWHAYADKYKAPIKDWFTVIYHYYKDLGVFGHGINDDIAEIGQRQRQKESPGMSKLYKDIIDHYLSVLKRAFNSDFDYDKISKFVDIVNWESTWGNKGQTGSFKYIEDFVKKGDKK